MIRATARRRFETPILALVVAVLAGASCTRDPFDRSRPEMRYPDQFTYTLIMGAAPIWQMNAAKASDGRLALAVVTDSDQIKVFETTAGVWGEISTISDPDLGIHVLDIAAGPSGAWWVLSTSSSEGVRLRRIGGAGDSTLSIPIFNTAPWDSTEGAITSDSAGRPWMLLKQRSQALVQVALADTGWAMTAVPQTGGLSGVIDMAMDPQDQRHLLFFSASGGGTIYRRITVDSTHVSGVPNSGEAGALAIDGDLEPWLAGSLGGSPQLELWRQEGGFDWQAEQLPAFDVNASPFNFGVEIASDGRPHALFSAFRGSERYDLYWATRTPDVVGINWDRTTVVSDVPKIGMGDRQIAIRMLMDDMGTLHFFFLSGEAGDMDSALYEAVPKD